ncbi:hypothetical protein [Photobacterium swingsii]|uniref:hypothetical protein n=1 Tax=Photobacterium swingsii TaxID=680026 RepID=UPI00066254D5|nr:hypothetical protein [Photobacterium swingsii]
MKNALGSSQISLADYNHETAELLDSGERSSSNKTKVKALAHHFFGQGHADKSVLRDTAKKQMERFDSQKITGQCGMFQHCD